MADPVSAITFSDVRYAIAVPQAPARELIAEPALEAPEAVDAVESYAEADFIRTELLNAALRSAERELALQQRIERLPQPNAVYERTQRLVILGSMILDIYI